MNLPLILGALWVIASAIVAMLPMRTQIAPGLFALGSMLCNPLRSFACLAPGHLAPLPKGLEK
jgi:hypothetical protein